MRNRLKEFMNYKTVSAAELADRIGVQRSNVSHILNGRNYPGAQFIEKLLNAFPDLDAGWLLTGQGSMLKEPEPVRKSSRESRHIPPLVENEGVRIPESKRESNPLKSEKIEKIVVFYSDRTFREYNPE